LKSTERSLDTARAERDAPAEPTAPGHLLAIWGKMIRRDARRCGAHGAHSNRVAMKPLKLRRVAWLIAALCWLSLRVSAQAVVSHFVAPGITRIPLWIEVLVYQNETQDQVQTNAEARAFGAAVASSSLALTYGALTLDPRVTVVSLKAAKPASDCASPTQPDNIMYRWLRDRPATNVGGFHIGISTCHAPGAEISGRLNDDSRLVYEHASPALATAGTFIHEMGHNWGFEHAHRLECDRGLSPCLLDWGYGGLSIMGGPLSPYDKFLSAFEI
jgi:hypothetical protein